MSSNSSLTIKRRRAPSFHNAHQSSHSEQFKRPRKYDPARNARAFWTESSQHRYHAHGVECHGYILLESTHRHGSVILGSVPGDIMEDLPSLTSRRDNRLELDADVVTTLNILGYHGYMVVGVSNTADSRTVWTLARKYFEFHDEL